MKLIIDIPEQKYNQIKEWEDNITGYQTSLVLYRAVRNGTPYEPKCDLISREDLKEALKECAYSYDGVNIWVMKDEVLGMIDNAPTVDAYTFNRVKELFDLNVQMTDEIENLKRPQGEWIPVSERLPAYSGLYLISVDDVVTVANFTGTYFMHRGGGRVEVYAWQPLPEPYEKGGAE